MTAVPAGSISGHLLNLGRLPRSEPREKGEAINYVQNNGTVCCGLIVGDIRHNKGTNDLDYYLLHEDRRDPGFGWVSGDFLKSDKEIEQLREQERREAEKEGEEAKKAEKKGKCVVS